MPINNQSILPVIFSLRHDVIELILRHEPIPIKICLFDHGLEFIFCDFYIELFGKSLKVLSRHEPGFLIIEQGEHFLDGFLGDLDPGAGGHDVDEGWEVQSAGVWVADVADDVEKRGVGLLVALGGEGCL